ncbi:hypothetical protein V866_002819 [Kwoniella sp. B9012]
MQPSRPHHLTTLDQTIHNLASQQATSKFIASMGRNPREQDLGSDPYCKEYWHAHRHYTDHFATKAEESSDVRSHIEGDIGLVPGGTKHGMNRIQYEQFPADGGAGTAATGGGREYRPNPGSPIFSTFKSSSGTSHGNTDYLGLPTHHNTYSPLSVQGWSGTNSPAPSTSGSGNGEDDGAGYPYYSGSEGGYDVSQGHTPDYSGNY